MSTTKEEGVEGGEYVQEDAGDTTFLCFGVCDMRIATIFMNGFNIGMIIIGVLVMGIRDNLFWKAMGAAFAAGIPGLILSAVGLYGAKMFEIKAMYLACGGFALHLIMDAILHEWVGFVVTSIVLFPHAVLTFEMREGLITKENYAEQEYVSPEGMEIVDKAHAYIAPTSATAM
mmetsp:Transcript_28507/g.61104  ORF Transcript_28507/g.61104 Transcript_28507/m.61104 type:complete len:174 (-) Transcript_28507:237-758(-)|eukprot:CAMPEP_0201116782 /NCGR_PEP_ID=MMETSP0850-20130426/963_1 /ASSEMBLY_ACC=CAM_ASM_000622 /TAXON_ID=183588 /ORGANISM="Pseudo-nitzschia fraudulenta, Strain WWA7" /LENGTH=173 /DNA_ID=CAMNT_0047380957 /DNA_START=55 /DNA_END=576 /DNA_ORIENTATION=-